jgi:hypothetical protein
LASRQIAVAMTARFVARQSRSRPSLPQASKAETGRDSVATEEERPGRQQTDTERYLLQIDRQTKRSFKTPEAAQAMALEIKVRFPKLQVSIYDSVGNSRTVVGEPRSA